MGYHDLTTTRLPRSWLGLTPGLAEGPTFLYSVTRAGKHMRMDPICSTPMPSPNALTL